MQIQTRVDTDARFIELDSQRKIRHRNKTYYRVLSLQAGTRAGE